MKKIGISLAALSFIVLGGNALAMPESDHEYKISDSNIAAVVEAIRKFPTDSPAEYTSGDKEIKFQHSLYQQDRFLKVIISKYDGREGQTKTVVIKDSNFDYLDKSDKITYHTFSFGGIHPQGYESTVSFRFDELSEQTQDRIETEYKRVLEEAPGKLAEAYKKYLADKAEERRSYERNILDVIGFESQYENEHKQPLAEEDDNLLKLLNEG